MFFILNHSFLDKVQTLTIMCLTSPVHLFIGMHLLLIHDLRCLSLEPITVFFKIQLFSRTTKVKYILKPVTNSKPRISGIILEDGTIKSHGTCC